MITCIINSCANIMNQKDQGDAQCIFGNMLLDESEQYPRDYQTFSKLYSLKCENDLLKLFSQNDQKDSGQTPVEVEDNQKNLGLQVSKTQIGESASEVFLLAQQPAKKKKGSSNCQNHPKLLSKVLCQLFVTFQQHSTLTDQARQYAKFGISKLKQKPTVNSLDQLFTKVPTQLIEEKQSQANSKKYLFSLNQLDLKNYQQELRRFIIERRQECLGMAAKRQISCIQRLQCFMNYVEAFINNLEHGVVKGKLKKF